MDAIVKKEGEDGMIDVIVKFSYTRQMLTPAKLRKALLAKQMAAQKQQMAQKQVAQKQKEVTEKVKENESLIAISPSKSSTLNSLNQFILQSSAHKLGGDESDICVQARLATQKKETVIVSKLQQMVRYCDEMRTDFATIQRLLDEWIDLPMRPSKRLALFKKVRKHLNDIRRDLQTHNINISNDFREWDDHTKTKEYRALQASVRSKSTSSSSTIDSMQTTLGVRRQKQRTPSPPPSSPDPEVEEEEEEEEEKEKSKNDAGGVDEAGEEIYRNYFETYLAETAPKKEKVKKQNEKGGGKGKVKKTKKRKAKRDAEDDDDVIVLSAFEKRAKKLERMAMGRLRVSAKSAICGGRGGCTESQAHEVMQTTKFRVSLLRNISEYIRTSHFQQFMQIVHDHSSQSNLPPYTVKETKAAKDTHKARWLSHVEAVSIKMYDAVYERIVFNVDELSIPGIFLVQKLIDQLKLERKEKRQKRESERLLKSMTQVIKEEEEGEDEDEKKKKKRENEVDDTREKGGDCIAIYDSITVDKSEGGHVHCDVYIPDEYLKQAE